MRIVSPRCAHCGSPLELLADNFRLHCPHCKSCHLLVEEDKKPVAKPARVQEVPRQAEWTEFDQKYAELRQKIDAVDRNWSLERTAYNYFREYPTEAEVLSEEFLTGCLWSLYGLCLILLFFISFWQVFATFSVLGLIYISVKTNSDRAESYLHALHRYRQQRSILLLKIELLRISPRKAA